MTSQPDLPFTAILDFLLQLELVEDLSSFYAEVMTGLTDLIPVGVSANCFAMIGPHPTCLANTGDTGEMHKFNGYYRQVFPFSIDNIRLSAQTDYRAWEKTEYVTDFLRGCGIWRTLASPSMRFSVSLNRARNERPFSEREIGILLTVNPHLETLCGRLRRHDEVDFMRVRDFELRSGDHFTRREVEVLRLASFRQSNIDIAASLEISRRTVEKHFANMYEKTGVTNRWELIRKYGAGDGRAVP